MTVRELTLRMSTRELAAWRRYVRQRRLPQERLQLQVALLAYMNRKDETLTFGDFVIGHEEEQAQTETVSAGVVAPLAGARVRVLGQKRNQPFKKRKG